MTAQVPVDLIDDPRRVAAVLAPLRRQILDGLRRPDSATGLARKLGIPRQKINYHLRELEREGFVELDEERQRRGCIERILRVTARAYVINPGLLGDLTADPDQLQDRFSSTYLVAAAGRLVRDVSTLRQRAKSAGQRLTTMTAETDVAFATPADLKAFAEELSTEIARLTAKYDQPGTTSRRHRFMVGAYPTITKEEEPR